MSKSFAWLLRKCFFKGLGWSYKQLYLTCGVLYFFWIPHFYFFLIFAIPIALFGALFLGCVTSLVVSRVYYLFYNRTGKKTFLVAVIAAVVVCSLLSFILLNIPGNMGYNSYKRDFIAWFVWYWVYLALNTVWLSRRVSKFAEQLLTESNKSAKETRTMERKGFMPKNFRGIVGECLCRGLLWGCVQVYLTSLVFIIPFWFFYLFYVIPVISYQVPIFGLLNGLIVGVVYWFFYKRFGRQETLLMAIVASVVICSSIFFISMTNAGLIVYNKYSRRLETGFMWFLLFLVINTIWLSWRLGKHAEALMTIEIESTKPAKEIPTFQNAVLDTIGQHIRSNYLSCTRYQLDTKLLALGYSPTEIEAAWKIFSASPALPRRSISSNLVLVAYLGFNFLVMSGVVLWVLATARYQ